MEKTAIKQKSADLTKNASKPFAIATREEFEKNLSVGRGMWKDRDITLGSIREKAWGRKENNVHL